MPEMDGLTLRKCVRGLKLEGYVYILFLTTRDTKEHIIAALEAGADDYLTKPVHEAELFARLKSCSRRLALEQELTAANERNRILSTTDALTGVYNRRYLMEQLPSVLQCCRRAKKALSLVMADIDFFKRINDGYGHAGGDEVLSLFALLTSRFFDGFGGWTARYGREEFVFVLPDTAHLAALHIAENLRATIAAEPLVIRAGAICVTASFGVATILKNGLDDALTAEQLIEKADAFLYTSKQSGRNRVTG